MTIDAPFLKELLAQATVWTSQKNVFTGAAVQAVVILLAAALGFLVGIPLRRRLAALLEGHFESQDLTGRLVRTIVGITPQLAVLCALFLAAALARDHFARRAMIEAATAILGAWTITRLLRAGLSNRLTAQAINGAIWALIILEILGLSDPLAAFLDAVSMTFGQVRISLLTLIKAIILFVALFKFGSWSASLAEIRLERSPDLTPSARTLIAQTLKVVIVAAAIFIPLNSLGIDLSALAVFSGALGVGLGFGLQKTAGNFISGVILLLDKSIKPGDVIELGGLYGWITAIHGRYSSVLTRDGTYYLIPNEELITTRVINWSFSSGIVRLKANIGVSYNTDLRLAMRLMEEAGNEHARVNKIPPPAARLIGFGDNSVDLELRFWIGDPKEGVVNVKGDVMLAIWDKFKAHGIEFPFPQRDVHLDIKADAGKIAAALKQAEQPAK